MNTYHADATCGACHGPLESHRDAICESCCSEAEFFETADALSVMIPVDPLWERECAAKAREE